MGMKFPEVTMKKVAGFLLARDRIEFLARLAPDYPDAVDISYRSCLGAISPKISVPEHPLVLGRFGSREVFLDVKFFFLGLDDSLVITILVLVLLVLDNLLALGALGADSSSGLFNLGARSRSAGRSLRGLLLGGGLVSRGELALDLAPASLKIKVLAHGDYIGTFVKGNANVHERHPRS